VKLVTAAGLVAALIVIAFVAIIVSGVGNYPTTDLRKSTKDIEMPETSPEQSPEPTQEATLEETPQLEGTVTGVQISEFTLNKETFSSNDEVQATIVIETGMEITGASARLYGIKASGINRIDSLNITDLLEGKNTVEFNTKTPNCTTGCGGVYPGQYGLTVEIIKDGEVLATSTKTIGLTE